MKFVWPIYITVCFLICEQTYVHSLDPELTDAVNAAVTYYNESLNLIEKADMVDKYYEMEWDEGIFLPIKLRIVPQIINKLHQEMDTLKFDSKHKKPKDKKIIRRIQDLEKELIDNYGPKDRNFRILKEDPLTQNILAVNRMKDRVKGLVQDFKEYTAIQRRFLDTYSVLRTQLGIHLSPSDDSRLFLFAQEDEIDGLLKKFGKSENFKESDNMDEIYERLHIDRNAPRQTSQEILALQGILANRVVDAVTKELLRGFIPDLNEKSLQIIAKLKKLENMMQEIEDESNEFVFRVMDMREGLFTDLDDLHKNFDVKLFGETNHEEL